MNKSERLQPEFVLSTGERIIVEWYADEKKIIVPHYTLRYQDRTVASKPTPAYTNAMFRGQAIPEGHWRIGTKGFEPRDWQLTKGWLKSTFVDTQPNAFQKTWAFSQLMLGQLPIPVTEFTCKVDYPTQQK